MRQALPIALAALLLGGCASHKPEDFNGTWINQDAIKAAIKGDSLRQALNEHGPVFEWKLDVSSQRASYSNGFEAADGQLSANDKQWQASFPGGQTELLALDGDELEATDQSGTKQTFVRAKQPGNTPLGGSFEKALYRAVLSEPSMERYKGDIYAALPYDIVYIALYVEEYGIEPLLKQGVVDRPSRTQAYLSFVRRPSGQYPDPPEFGGAHITFISSSSCIL